jgi:hypothetical protein
MSPVNIAPGSARARALKPIREGFRAKYVVLPSESRHEFSELCDDLEAEWQPQTRTEQFMVEQMAVSQWKLTRLEIGEVSLYAQELDGRAQLPLICKISALQARLERSYFQAMRQLEHMQASRRHRAALEQKAAKVALDQRPVNPPEPESIVWQAPVTLAPIPTART